MDILMVGIGKMGIMLGDELTKFGNVFFYHPNSERLKDLNPHKEGTNYDVIILAVPIEKIVESAKCWVNSLKEDGVLVDISSVKIPLVNEIEKFVDKEYVSIHPLFGYLKDIKGENVVLIPVKGNKWIDVLEKWFEDIGCITTVMDAEKHDIIMSRVQVSHHFVLIVLNNILEKNHIKPNLYTASLKKTLKAIERVKEGKEVAVDIQKMNTYGKEARREVIEECKKLKDLMDYE